MKTGSLLLFILVTFLNSSVCSQSIKGKVNGISLWSDDKKQLPQDFDFIEASAANWVSLQPYGVLDTDSTGVRYDIEGSWECSSFDGLKKTITILHEKGYKICLKPHLILGYEKPGVWVGNLNLGSAKKWNKLSETYSAFIIDLARIAQSLNVELFSIGTELGSFPRKEHKSWERMIDSIKVIYHGDLTYSANFDAYRKFPFWNELDYMGVDAYFTVDTSKTPQIDSCKKNWEPIKERMKHFSTKKGLSVIFTEYGYHSSDYCGLEPYASHSSDVNLAGQANAYRALFYTFWYEEWFKGGFSWSWHFGNEEPEGYDNIYYQPQNKPAEGIIRKMYLHFGDKKN